MLQALDARSDISAGMLQTLEKLSDAARARLDPAVNVRAFIDRLCSEGLHSDAVDILTHLLPKQYSIAWGCECLQELNAHGTAAPADVAALSVTKRWLADPSEENRRAAIEIADRLRYQGPGAWLAAAAGWTAGSMLPAGQPEVPVAPTLTGDAIGAAVRLAAAAEPAAFAQRMQLYVERALAAFAPRSA